MEQHRDEHIVCASCGTSFLFSAAEAAVYAERRLAAPPKRCRTCRRARKDNRGEHESASTARAAQHQRPGPARSAGGGFRGAARGDGRPRKPHYTGDVNEYRSPMQDAYSGLAPAWTAPSQFPRRPRGGAPARDDGNYRAPSFAGERRAPAQGRAAAQPPRAPRNRPTFSITCKSCGSEGEVPFKPVEGRDVFCQACYRARKPS
ncbi:zinc-ribbon domain containing protein [Sorangium sp. So ce542]|uniref:zinc-ribbon domain containing protein n=1 Tax=Sorangium sp. So ce542 TaxID=3133316 RepID=UPI003F5E0193